MLLRLAFLLMMVFDSSNTCTSAIYYKAKDGYAMSSARAEDCLAAGHRARSRVSRELNGAYQVLGEIQCHESYYGLYAIYMVNQNRFAGACLNTPFEKTVADKALRDIKKSGYPGARSYFVCLGNDCK